MAVSAARLELPAEKLPVEAAGSRRVAGHQVHRGGDPASHDLTSLTPHLLLVHGRHLARSVGLMNTPPRASGVNGI